MTLPLTSFVIIAVYYSYWFSLMIASCVPLFLAGVFLEQLALILQNFRRVSVAAEISGSHDLNV